MKSQLSYGRASSTGSRKAAWGVHRISVSQELFDDRSARDNRATSADGARADYATFERTWAKRCPGVVTSLQEGGNEPLAFFEFPKAQREALPTTNPIERLREEFRRRVKTQGSLPNEDAAPILLFSLLAAVALFLI